MYPSARWGLYLPYGMAAYFGMFPALREALMLWWLLLALMLALVFTVRLFVRYLWAWLEEE